MSRQRLGSTYSYQALEARQLLAIDFSLGEQRLNLIQEPRGAFGFGTLLVQQTGEWLALTQDRAGHFNGVEIAGQLRMSADRLTLEIHQSLFSNGTIDSILVDMTRGNHMDTLFGDGVDLASFADNFSLFTRGRVEQQGSLVAGNLSMAANEIFLTNPLNQIESLSANSSTNVELETVRVAVQSDLFIHSIQADSGVAIQARNLWLGGPVTAGDVVELNASENLIQEHEKGIRAPRFLFSSGLASRLSADNNRWAEWSGTVGSNLWVTVNGDSTLISGESRRGVIYQGLTVAGDMHLQTKNNGSWTQASNAPLVVGNRAFFSFAGTGEMQMPGGDRDSDGRNDNNLFELNILSADNAVWVDRNNLNLGNIEVQGGAWFRSGSAELGRLTLQGGVRANSGLWLQSNAGIQQTAGMLQTPHLFLGGSAEGTNRGNWNLSRENFFRGLSAFSSIGNIDLRSVAPVEIRRSSWVDAAAGDKEVWAGLRGTAMVNLSAAAVTDDPNAQIVLGTGGSWVAADSIAVGDQPGNAVNAGELWQMQATSGISVGAGGLANLAGVNFRTNGTATLRQVTDIVLVGQNSAAAFNLGTTGALTTAPQASLTATLPSQFSATGAINLATESNQNLSLGDASFLSQNNIRVGTSSAATIGRVRFESPADVDIRVSGFLSLFGSSQANNLVLRSTSVIRDAANARLEVDGTTLLAAAQGVSLADASTNFYRLCGEVTFEVGNYVLMHDLGSVLMNGYRVPLGAFTDIRIDGPGC